MEYIFAESIVLASFIETELTPQYIKENYKEILPEFLDIENLQSDFDNLYSANLAQIKHLENILIILHKYGIKKYYNIMLEYIVWEILNLKIIPSILCSDIINDIINYNNDFTKILKHLLTNESPDLTKEDYTFSIPLYKSLHFKHKNVDNINLEYAIKYGLLDVIIYLFERRDCSVATICNRAAEYGKLEILEWAHKNGCQWNEMTCAYAAYGGNIDILKWLRMNDCPWNEITCAKAALGGNFDILKWARKNGCRWDEMTCTFAAAKGCLEILQWARENGCPWNAATCNAAAYNGHSEIVIWARKNGCPCNSYYCQVIMKKYYCTI